MRKDNDGSLYKADELVAMPAASVESNFARSSPDATYPSEESSDHLLVESPPKGVKTRTQHGKSELKKIDMYAPSPKSASDNESTDQESKVTSKDVPFERIVN